MNTIEVKRKELESVLLEAHAIGNDERVRNVKDALCALTSK